MRHYYIINVTPYFAIEPQKQILAGFYHIITLNCQLGEQSTFFRCLAFQVKRREFDFLTLSKDIKTHDWRNRFYNSRTYPSLQKTYISITTKRPITRPE